MPRQKCLAQIVYEEPESFRHAAQAVIEQAMRVKLDMEAVYAREGDAPAQVRRHGARAQGAGSKTLTRMQAVCVRVRERGGAPVGVRLWEVRLWEVRLWG